MRTALQAFSRRRRADSTEGRRRVLVEAYSAGRQAQQRAWNGLGDPRCPYPDPEAQAAWLRGKRDVLAENS